MALYTRSRRLMPVRGTNGALPELGGDKVIFRIDPQPRHLSRVLFVATITVTSGSPAPTASKDSLEGVWDKVQLLVNDSTSGRRTAIDAKGSSLIHWARHKGVPVDSHTKRAFNPTATGTYYVTTPVYIEDPSLPDTVGCKTAMPLYDSGNRPKINEALEFRLTPGAAGLNVAGGSTIAITDVQAIVEFLDNVGEKLPYVPTSLLQSTWGAFSAAGVPQEFPIEKDGYLGSLLFEAYSTYSTLTAGNALGSGQKYSVKQDNTDIDEFDALTSRIENEQYFDSTFTASGPRALVGPVFMRDYLHNSTGNMGHLPYSMPRVWADSSRVRVTSTGVAQNAGVDILTHKFLAPDNSVLAGV